MREPMHKQDGERALVFLDGVIWNRQIVRSSPFIFRAWFCTSKEKDERSDSYGHKEDGTLRRTYLGDFCESHDPSLPS